MPEHEQAVILLHGIGDNRGGVAGHGQAFLRKGYRILLPNSRAHGESGGFVATYGLRESDDIRRWVYWLYAPLSLILLSPISAYDSGRIFRGSWSFWYGGHCRKNGRIPRRRDWSSLCSLRYGVDLRRANPVEAVRSSMVPVLLIHGEEDINIRPWHSRALAQADPVYAQLWLVPGAGHCGAMAVASEEFWSRVLTLIARHNTAQPGSVTQVIRTGVETRSPTVAMISKNKSPGSSSRGCWRLTSGTTDTACHLYRRAALSRCQAYL